jgi:hypothetical protein
MIDQLLPEDYLTCLAEDDQGVVWIGTRQSGFKIADPKTGKQALGDPKKMGLPDNFITKILMFSEGDYWVGFYGGGIIKPIKPYKLVDRKPLKTKFNKQKIFSVAQKDFPNLPSKIKPPTIDELKLMQAKLDRLKTPLPKIYAAYYGEDWKTQGDWMGRVFTEWGILCATASPFDHYIRYSNEYYNVIPAIGPNHPNYKDAIRRYCRGMKTNDLKALWNPYNNCRRQAEWDDHGEAYPFHIDGPDLWYLLEIKHKGIFRLGMYFVNPDGHIGNNRMRDYLIAIYPTEMKWRNKPSDTQLIGRQGETLVRKMTPLAKGRISDFWGGVHLQFVVSGPCNYLVKIDRNYGFNTIVSSVTIDQIYGIPTLYVKEKWGVPLLQQIPYDAPPFPKIHDTGEGKLLQDIWTKLDNVCGFQKGIELQRKNRIQIYQASTAIANADKQNESLSKLAKTIKWRLNQWDTEQRLQHSEIMHKAWQKFYYSNEALRKSIEEQKKGVPDFIKNRKPVLYD